MKAILIFYAFASTIPAFASNSKPLAKIIFNGNSRHHVYSVVQEGSDGAMRLEFRESSKPVRLKTLSKGEANFILSEATRILWRANLTESRNAPCTPYVRIVTPGEKGQICSENQVATGLSYGLLNSLRRRFE